MRKLAAPPLPGSALPPPKRQSHSRPEWPQSTRCGCRSAIEAGEAVGPAAGAGGMAHRRRERSSLAEASRPPHGDQRTLLAEGHSAGRRRHTRTTAQSHNRSSPMLFWPATHL